MEIKQPCGYLLLIAVHVPIYKGSNVREERGIVVAYAVIPVGQLYF